MITNNTKAKTITYWAIYDNVVHVKSFGPGHYFTVETTDIWRVGPFSVFYKHGNQTLYIFDHNDLWDCVNANGQGVPMQHSSRLSEEDVRTVGPNPGLKSTISMGETTAQSTLNGVLELVAIAAKLRGVSFVSSASTVINESGLDVELKIRPYPACATTAMPTRSDNYMRASDCVSDDMAGQYDVQKAMLK